VGLNDISEFLPEILQLCPPKKYFSVQKSVPRETMIREQTKDSNKELGTRMQ